jgi:glycosyltransferase involved in cell wall biosynthesis
MIKTIVVIPAYNPTSSLLSLCSKLAENKLDILIVDDGSDDRSLSIFSNLIQNGYSVLTHSKNMGKGASLKTAFRHLINYPKYSHIITCDADGQHLPNDIISLEEKIYDTPEALVIGSRNFDSSVPFRSRIGNSVSSFLFGQKLGFKILDSQSGLRAFPLSFAVLSLDIPFNRYEFESHQLLLARDQGLSFIQIPIQTIYLDKNSSSHFNPLVDSFKIYSTFFRYFFTSLYTFCVDFLVFIIVFYFSNSVLISTLSARLVSIAFQFFFLSTYVFLTSGFVRFILFISYVLLMGLFSSFLQVNLSSLTDLSIFSSKIFIDGILFFLNYFLMKNFLFSFKFLKNFSLGSIKKGYMKKN